MWRVRYRRPGASPVRARLSSIDTFHRNRCKRQTSSRLIRPASGEILPPLSRMRTAASLVPSVSTVTHPHARSIARRLLQQERMRPQIANREPSLRSFFRAAPQIYVPYGASIPARISGPEAKCGANSALAKRKVPRRRPVFPAVRRPPARSLARIVLFYPKPPQRATGPNPVAQDPTGGVIRNRPGLPLARQRPQAEPAQLPLPSAAKTGQVRPGVLWG